MIEKIEECIASGDLVLVGIGDECSLKAPYQRRTPDIL